ncbi:hypothetical protein BH09PSE5_BH09PSE5_07080 [soil metagenome]
MDTTETGADRAPPREVPGNAPSYAVTPSWGKRLLWLVAIWTASVATLGIAAYAMRMLMRLAGMGT